jgi:O-antigen/teichoic acid export membrane protein
VPWVSLGWALYGLWVVFLVIAGRAHVTRRNLPAALAGVGVNVVLLLVLVPRYGIAGGGIALCGAYVAMLAVMHLLVRRVFAVSFEWRRLGHLITVIAAVTVSGELLLPTQGAAGLLLRALAFVAIGPLLLATGFARRREIDGVRALLARLRTARTRPAQTTGAP